MSRYKIKTKWRKTPCEAVFENENGSRIHLSGLLRYRNGVTVKIGNGWLSQDFSRIYKIFGFCNRRTLMFIAEVMGA